jgi:cell fate (sporulation/competence/biofilm development) regulator YlbF (YheA/YmcA/DUF963 family)
MSGQAAETTGERDPAALARDLGAALAATPEHEAFVAARAAVEDDPEAQALIEEFEREREAFEAARARDEATRGDLRELERLQAELHDRETVSEFLAAKAALEDRLDAAAAAVSDPLALEFGAGTGDCCMD